MRRRQQGRWVRWSALALAVLALAVAARGLVRHNTWYSQGKENVAADAARKRMLYLVGLGVELETGLRAIAKGAGCC